MEYAPALRLVPLGTQAEEGAHIGSTETSIDSLQAAPFLFWAAGVTGEPTLREVATDLTGRSSSPARSMPRRAVSSATTRTRA